MILEISFIAGFVSSNYTLGLVCMKHQQL